MKKVPIHLSDEDEENIKRVGDLLGMGGVYGEIPKALRFGISFTLAEVERLEKVIPDLEAAELDLLFTMVKNQRAKRKALEALATAQKEVAKYNPPQVKSIPASIPNPS